MVVPAFQEKAGILDAEIKELNDSKKGPRENAERILSLHKILVDTINKFTETNKRSFASKYLHFHCPQQFPIFDSRASSAAQRIAQRLNHSDFPESWKKCDHDPQYADFFARVLAIKEKIETERRTKVSPRDIDNFLLFFDDKH